MTRGIHNTTRPRRLPLSLVGRASSGAVVEPSYDFAKIFRRMTAAECVNVCNHYSLLSSVPVVGTGDGECPSELSAEGALSWMMWNEGRGEWYTTSTPADISPATMRLWLDAKDQSTLFSDAGVTPITDGGAVQQWNDKSGGGRHFSQATVGLRPTWSNAGQCVDFVGYGTNDLLSSGLTGSNFFGATYSTLFMVVTIDSSIAGTKIYGDTGNVVFGAWNGTGFQSYWFNGSSYGSASVAGSVGPKYVVMSRRFSNAGTPTNGLSVNGGAETATAHSGNPSLSGVFGLPASGGDTCPMKIHEVVIHNAEIGDTDRNNLGLYLASKHNTLWLPKINDYRYRGSLFAANRRANDVRDYLEARFDEDKPQFMAALSVSAPRAIALKAVIPPGETSNSSPRSPTKIIFWDSYVGTANNAFDKLMNDNTYKDIANARSNLVRLDPAFWGYSAATIKTILDSRPVGRRALAMGGYHPFWAEPITAGPASGRYRLYDRQANTAKRCGASLEDWWTWANDPANGLLKFLTDLKAAGASLDYLITDVEQWNRMWQLQWGTPSDLNTSGRVEVTSVNTSTNTLTSVGHGFASGEIVAFFYSGAGSALPAPLVTTKIYYIRSDVTADTFTVSETSGGAAVDITTTGAAHIYALRESWAQIINDPNWTANHGNLANGVRGMITPAMDQEVWKAIPSINTFTSELAFNWDAHMSHYFGKYFSNLLGQCKAIYPNLIISDYEMSAYAPGTIYTVQSAGECQYGAGHTAAGVSSPPMYGDWYHERWNWSTLSNQSFDGTADEDKWGAFSTQIMRLRSAFAGTHSGSMQPWLSHENYVAYQKMGTAGLWAEFILHAATLSDGVVNYYQPTATFTSGENDAAIAAAQYDFISLIEECDDVLAHPSTGDPGENIPTYTEAFIASRAWAGNRFVWRVTPNPNATSQTVTDNAPGVTFANSLGTLTITGGNVHASSQSALAPLGYWVESAT